MKISSKKQKPFSSWHASGVAIRDARQIKDDPDEWSTNKQGKPDKEWCKGKKGKEHKLEWKLYEELGVAKHWWIGFSVKRPHNPGKLWAALYCTRCYRILNWDKSGKKAKELRKK